MSATSWLAESERDGFSDRRDRRASRQPLHSRPSLESLEERTLLDASNGLIGGAFNNPNLNSNFNFASSGNVLSIPGASNFGTSGISNGANPQHSLTFTGLANSEVGAQAASSSFLAQDQLYGQFRIFGINSQGDNPNFSQRVTTQNILRDAYGFGSGTLPNRPWMPAAYNLGLANGQFGYSSQSDNGFSSVPPWSYPQQRTIPLAQTQPKDQWGTDEETEPDKPEQAFVQKTAPEEEGNQHNKMDDDLGDRNEDSKFLHEKPQNSKQQVADEVSLRAEEGVPDSLMLYALAPAPMAALIAGLPGMTCDSGGGDSGAEAGEAVGAPE